MMHPLDSSAASPESRWLSLPAQPESAARCRDFARDVLQDWGLQEAADDVMLLVSELTSNVVRHARTPMRLYVRWDPAAQTLHVSMRDESSDLPVVRGADDLAWSGRGLRIVASLARQWGVERLPVGKVVWFDLALDGRS